MSDERCDHCQKPLSDDGRLNCLECQVANAKHKQIITKGGFPVDEQLVKLIEFLNDNNVMTLNSCQDNTKKRAWIQVSDQDDLKTLLMMAKLNDCELEDVFLDEKHWSMCFDEDSFAEDLENFDISGDRPEMHISYSWRFPADQIETVTKIMCSWCA